VILFYLTLKSLSVLIVKVVAEDKFSDEHEQVGSVAQKNVKRMKEIVQFDGQMHVKLIWKKQLHNKLHLTNMVFARMDPQMLNDDQIDGKNILIIFTEFKMKKIS
jgi:hypothetical protein